MAVAEPEETMAADGGVDSYIRAYRKERLGGDVREAARMLGESDRRLRFYLLFHSNSRSWFSADSPLCRGAHHNWAGKKKNSFWFLFYIE
jgi:hypothetical protein